MAEQKENKAKTKVKKKKDLTPKQRLWIKAYFEEKTNIEAVKKAGYNCKNNHSAHSIGCANKKNLEGTIKELMDKMGISDEKLLNVLIEGLEANKVLGYLNNKVNGVEKVSDEFVDVPDHAVRHKFLDTALKLKGAYSPEKVEHSGEVKQTVSFEEAVDIVDKALGKNE